MRNYVTLYVPTQYQTILEYAKIAFASVAGGSTSSAAEGLWIDDNGDPVFDDIVLVKSFVADELLSALTATAQVLALQLKLAGEQSVAIEINGELTFVEDDGGLDDPEARQTLSDALD
jgi:hypothetical protein